MSWKLDTADRTQVQTPESSRRTIYDASSSEIFWKSLTAGFALGLGQALATALFFGVIAGLLVTTIRPLLDQFKLPLEDLEVVLQQRINPATPSFTPPTTPTTTTVGE